MLEQICLKPLSDLVPHHPITVKAYLHYGFISEQWLVTSLCDLHKASFNASSPANTTFRLPHQLNKFPN